MSRVFVVHHVHEYDDDSEDVKLVGVYSSEARALEAIADLQSRPGFREAPEGFHISDYEVDQDYWADGYQSDAD